MPLVIVLPWPAKALHPNARSHWAPKAKAVKAARREAWGAAMEAGLGRIKADSISVTAIFNPPDKHRRDEDGMFAACKSYFDGIADATGIDDSRWTFAMRTEEPRKPGSVRIEIQPGGVPLRGKVAA